MSHPSGSDGASPKLWFAVLTFWARNGRMISSHGRVSRSFQYRVVLLYAEMKHEP